MLAKQDNQDKKQRKKTTKQNLIEKKLGIRMFFRTFALYFSKVDYKVLNIKIL